MKRVKLSLAVVALAIGVTASAFTMPNRVTQGWFEYNTGDPQDPASYAQLDFTKSDQTAQDDCNPINQNTCAAKFVENQNGTPAGTPETILVGDFQP